MAFNDLFRLSSLAVILNEYNQVLLLKANYGSYSWGLPGGALEPGETIHDALLRECQEELNTAVTIDALTGVYYHSAYNSQAFIFRCLLSDTSAIQLSHEHTEWQFWDINKLSTVQQLRISDCLNYTGVVISRKF